MSNIFSNDIFKTIAPPSSSMYMLKGVKLPNSHDVYFMAKWHELFQRYQSARLFLLKAYDGEWESWFNASEEDDTEKAKSLNDHVSWVYKSELYEASLINYNILVDLSWTITYVSAEFMLYKFDRDGNVIKSESIQGMHSIDEAIDMLRRTENGTMAPSAENNPFVYLKKMAPQFEPAIERITNFWNWFGNTDIRKLYNYIKHKGKPIYTELDDNHDFKLISLIINNEEYPSDIRDVQKRISVEEGINELISFDNDHLYLYLYELIKDLKQAVNPSPMIM